MYRKTTGLIFIFLLISSALFAQFEIDSLKAKWNNDREPIEGIYKLTNSQRSYSVAVAREKTDGFYKLVYLDGAADKWFYGDLKAIVTPTDDNTYEGRWNAGIPDEPLLENVKIAFGNKKFILYWSDWSIDEFRMTYPEEGEAKSRIDQVFTDDIFKRKNITVPIQLSDSGLVEIPISLNGVLKIYTGLEASTRQAIVSLSLAKTLIQTKTLSFEDWIEGNYYNFIDKNKPLEKINTFYIRSIVIGNAEVKDIEAVIDPGLEKGMQINIDVLEQIGKVNIDLENETLSIRKK